MIEAVLVVSLLAQAAERVPKTMTDAERMNDKVVAAREYDSNARALMSHNFADAIDAYAPGKRPELVASWGEFVSVDGMPFIALQLAGPFGASSDSVSFFGRVVECGAPLPAAASAACDGKIIATYNEKLPVQTSGDDKFIERSLLIPLTKSRGTFGVARGGEILAMTRVAFDPDSVTSSAAAVSRLIVSGDVHLLAEAQKPRDPFAFGGTKVVPKPGAAFRRSEPLWLFAEVRNPSLAPDGAPHIVTKLSIAPSNVSSPPTPAEATALKGMAGHYGIGNSIDIAKLAPGDYTVRVVFTDLISRQSFTREAAIHVRE
jgi:hypothetical protein